MTQSSDQIRYKAANTAAAAVGSVVLFAIAFAALAVFLVGGIPDDSDADSVPITAAKQTDPFYVLLIGSDTRRGTALYTGQAKDESQITQFADIITLMRVDPSTYTITLVTIPRDTTLTPTGNKINASLLSNNPADVVTEVSKLTKVNIDYYMMTTFVSFENLVNALDGITVDVPVTITGDDPASGKKVTVSAGKNRTLDGTQALVLARARHEYGHDQDALRQRNVRSLEEALVRRVLSMGKDIDVGHVLAALEHDTYTNIDLPSMGLTIEEFVTHADELTVYTSPGQYQGGARPSDKAWVVSADDETWTQLMSIVDAGEDPSGFIPAPEF